MRYIKSTTGATIINDEGKLIMFPLGTTEFSFIENDGFNENFPFLKDFSIKNGDNILEYSCSSRAFTLNGFHVPFSIGIDLKNAIYEKNDEAVETFMKTFGLHDRYMLSFIFTHLSSELDAIVDNAFSLNLSESSIISYVQGDYAGDNSGKKITVICKVIDGKLEFLGSAISNFKFEQEYNTVFTTWLKFLEHNDEDAFFDELNRKLNISYSLKEHMISNAKLHGPLSDIIIEIDPKQIEDDEDTYDEIF